MECEFDLSELEQALRVGSAKLGRDVASAVEPALQAGVATAKSSARFVDRTGRARQSIDGVVVSSVRADDSDGADGELRCMVPYASFLNDGTPPHEIHPKAGRGFVGPLQHANQTRGRRKARSVLSWLDGGERRFAAVVHHPGTRPDGFMDRGAEAAEKDLLDSIDEASRDFEEFLSR